jgi:hypothetical protein
MCLGTPGGPLFGGQVPYVFFPAAEQLDLVQNLGGGSREMWYRIEINIPYPFNRSTAIAQLGGAAGFFAEASKRRIKILPLLLPDALLPGRGGSLLLPLPRDPIPSYFVGGCMEGCMRGLCDGVLSSAGRGGAFSFSSDLAEVEAAAAEVTESVVAVLGPLGATVRAA